MKADDATKGAVAAVASGPLAALESSAFREAMSRLGAAVHIVTTAGLAGKSGFTATAVCSVSDQPATLLVCLNRSSGSAPLLSQNGVFCVNTLGAGEEKLADLFAGRTGVQRHERFATGEWITLRTGAPVLASAFVRSTAAPSKSRRSASLTTSFSAWSSRPARAKLDRAVCQANAPYRPV